MYSVLNKDSLTEVTPKADTMRNRDVKTINVQNVREIWPLMMSQVILVKRRKTVLIVLIALIARSYLRGTDSAPKRFRKDIDLIIAMY